MEDIKREKNKIAFNILKIAKDEPKTSENMDEIEAKFVKRLKRGTKK